MKRPEAVRHLLAQRFQKRAPQWLCGEPEAEWQLVVNLDIPTEQEALADTAMVKSWIAQWQQWTAGGEVIWETRRWSNLGTQTLPRSLVLADPAEVARVLGPKESARWHRAVGRFSSLCLVWPQLRPELVRHFMVLADYDEADYDRLVRMVQWLIEHPESGYYPRQIPLAGMDTKWVESRRATVAAWLAAIRGTDYRATDFYRLAGLRQPPGLVRIRVLDPQLRKKVAGMNDISVPIETLSSLDICAKQVLVVENLQTGLALPDFAGTIAILARGYAVDLLSALPWLQALRCFYWGDIDQDGFAILNRARSHLPGLRSVLMDENTLEQHMSMCGPVKPAAVGRLDGLTDEEKRAYQRLLPHARGTSLRLEQERIDWAHAVAELRRALDTTD